MTTVAKAKEAQKQAEHVISWGKRGGKSNWDKANSYLLNPTSTLRPLFSTFAERYAKRPGGYTRLHRAGFRVGDHAPLAVLELVDSPHDLKFETAAKTVGREIAVRAREAIVGEDQYAGKVVWHNFRRRVEGGSEAEVLEKLGEAFELHELTRKNVQKVLVFRRPEPVLLLNDGTVSPSATSTADADVVEASSATPEAAPEADEASPSASLSPSTEFLNRAHHHYLRNLATFNLSTTPEADPDRQIKQLERRLNPSDYRGPPKPVLIVPLTGRNPKAGERTDGWNLRHGVEPTPKFGGPIGKAKGSRGREGRKVVWTGTKKSEEELAA